MIKRHYLGTQKRDKSNHWQQQSEYSYPAQEITTGKQHFKLSPTVVLQLPYGLISLPSAVTRAAISTVASSALCSPISCFSATSTSCSDHNSARRHVAPTNTSDGEVFHSSSRYHICERYPGYHTHGYNIGRIFDKNKVKSRWPTKQAWRHHLHFSLAYNTGKGNYYTLTSCLALHGCGSLPKLGTTAERKTGNIQSTLMWAADLHETRSVPGGGSDLLSHTAHGQRAPPHSPLSPQLELNRGFSHTFVFCSRSGKLLAVLEIWGQGNKQPLETGHQDGFIHPDNWTDARQTMFGKGKAAGKQLCSAAGDVTSLESKMGRELWCILSLSQEQELGMEDIHTNVGKSRTEGGRNKQTGRRRCWKPAGEQLFLGESRKDFALRKAVGSYFCTDFKVHQTQLWKLHVVFLAGNINVPYGEASVWALQYCLDLILTYFHYWTRLELYVLFFSCMMGETNP